MPLLELLFDRGNIPSAQRQRVLVEAVEIVLRSYELPAKAAPRARASARPDHDTTRRGRTAQAVNRYRALLDAADATDRTHLINAVYTDDTGEDELDEALWGPTATAAEAAASEINQIRLQFERRREVARSAVTREAVAGLLGVSTQAILNHIHQGDLVGLRDGKRWLLPLWQFDADGERGFLPGIAEVRQAFPGGVVSLSQWMTRPSVDLGERSPRDALAAGEVRAVAGAARALTSAGW